jgi:ketosteroid isomerase-like protein
MRPLAVSIYLLAAAACAGAPAAPASQPAASRPVTAADVRGVVEEWRQAFEVHSLDKLVALYDHSDDLIVVRESRRLRAWSSFYPELKEFITRNPKIQLRLGDLSTAALGPGGAVASSTALRRYGDEHTMREEQGALTLVLRRGDDGVWRIVAEHWSFAPAR